MKKTLIYGLAIGSLLSGATAARGATIAISARAQGTTITIDDFSIVNAGNLEIGDGAFPPTDFGSVTTIAPVTGQNNDPIIGGRRINTARIPNFVPDPNNFDSVIVNVDGGVLTQTNLGGYNTITGLIWNGPNGSGLNKTFQFSNPSQDGFYLDSVDFNNPSSPSGNVARLIFQVTDNASNVARYINNFGNGSLPSLFIPYDQIAPQSPGFSFNNVNTIELIIQSADDQNGDPISGLGFTVGTRLTPTTDIPEPSTGLACLVLAGGQVAWLGWKKFTKNREKL